MFITLTNTDGSRLYLNVNLIESFFEFEDATCIAPTDSPNWDSTDRYMVKETLEEVMDKINAVLPNVIKTYLVTYYNRRFACEGDDYDEKTFKAYSLQEAITQAEYHMRSDQSYDGIHKIEAYEPSTETDSINN